MQKPISLLLLFLSAFLICHLSARSTLASAEGVALADDWEVEEGDDVYEGDEPPAQVDVGGDESSEDPDVVVLNEANFDAAVKKYEYLLVEFYAPWCGHCTSLKPEYAAAATELKAEKVSLALAKVDAPANKDLATRHGVTGFPTLVWYVRGERKEYKGGRESETIVSWVKKQTGPAAVVIASAEEATEFVSRNRQFAAAYFEKLEGAEWAAFEEAAKGEDGITFAVTTNAEAAALLRIPSPAPSVAITKKDDEPFVAFEGNHNTAELAKFFRGNKLALVLPFNGPNSDKIFTSGIDRQLILFVSKEDEEKILPAYTAAAKTVKGDVLFVTVDTAAKDLSNVKEYFGYKGNEPQLYGYLSQGESGETYVWDEGELNEQNLKSFSKRFAEGKLTPFYKSEDVPASNDGAVKIVVGNSFDEIVLDESKDVFLEVHSPDCTHCKSLEPIYYKLAKRFRNVPSIVIAKINGEANEHTRMKAEGFPTLLFFPAGKKSADPIEFAGDKTLSDMTKFLRKHATIPFTLEKKKAVEEVVVSETTETDAAPHDASPPKDEL